MPKNIIFTEHVVSQTVEYIIQNLMNKIKQIQMLKNNMNPYTSLKVNSLINQIGSLLLDTENKHQQTPKNLNQQNISSIRLQSINTIDDQKHNKTKIASKRSIVLNNICQQNQQNSLLKDNLMPCSVNVLEKQLNDRNSFQGQSELVSSTNFNKSIKQNNSFYVSKKLSTRSKQSHRRYTQCLENKAVQNETIPRTNQKQKTQKFNNHTQSTQIFTASKGYSNEVNKSNEKDQRYHEQTKKGLISLISPNGLNSRQQRKISAFDILPQKILKMQLSKQEQLQNLIDSFRVHKIQEQIQKAKLIQKQQKLNNLLKKDQTILCFNYEGDFVKKNKRQIDQIKQNMGKGMHLTYGLSTTKQWDKSLTFWKDSQKKRNNTKAKPNELKIKQNRLQSSLEKDTKPSIRQQRTTPKKLDQLKKLSVQITNKNKVKFLQQNGIAPKKSRNFNFKNDVITRSQNIRFVTKEQQKQITQQIEYLQQNLQKYHIDQKNKMPQWYKNIEKGCSIKIFEEIKQIFPSNNKSLQNNNKPKSPQNRNNKQSSSHSDKNNKANPFCFQGSVRQIKEINNIQIQDRKQIQLIKQWQQKRQFCQKLQIQQAKIQKSKKQISQSKSRLQKDYKLIKLQQIQQQNYESNQNPEIQKIRGSQKHSQSGTNLRKSNPNKQINKELQQKRNTKIHSLTRKQFQFVKEFLQYERIHNIRRNKQRLSNNDSSIHLKSKTQEDFRNQLSDFVKNNPGKYKNLHSPILKNKTQKSQNDSDINLIQKEKINPRLISLIKPRSFSVLERGFSDPRTPLKRKNSGRITVSNDKLISSLLEYSAISQLPDSSILNADNSDQVVSSDKLQKISKNSKSQHLLPLNFQDKGYSLQKSVSFNLQSSNIIQIKSDAFISSKKQVQVQQNRKSRINQKNDNLNKRNVMYSPLNKAQNQIKIVQKINKKSQFRNIVMKSNLLKTIDNKIKRLKTLNA